MKHIPPTTVLSKGTRVAVAIGVHFIGEVISGELRTNATGQPEAFHRVKLLKIWMAEDFKFRRLQEQAQITREFNHKVIQH